jgi:hypothetical protein
LLALRKNNYRQQQLKKIDTENLKIFQNLLRIKSSLSKSKMDQQDRKNSSLRQMLAHYDNRLDPLISIEQRMKQSKDRRRHPSPFTLKNNSIMDKTQSTAIGSAGRTQTLGYIGVQETPSIASINNKRAGTGYGSNVSTTLGGARFTTRTGELRAPPPGKKYSQSPGGSALNSTYPRYGGGGGSSARGNPVIAGGNRTSPRNIGRDLVNGSKTV